MIPPYPYDFDQDGPLVTTPAIVGGVLFALPGALLGPVICLPVLGKEPLDKIKACAVAGAMATGVVGSTLVGAPFYFVKKILWDIPKSLITYKQEKHPEVDIGLD